MMLLSRKSLKFDQYGDGLPLSQVFKELGRGTTNYIYTMTVCVCVCVLHACVCECVHVYIIMHVCVCFGNYACVQPNQKYQKQKN